MTTAAEKVFPAAPDATATAASADKHADKRKALGRGLESLLPRVVPAVNSGEAAANAAPANAPTSSAATQTTSQSASANPHSIVIAEMHAQAAKLPGDTVTQVRLDHIDANPYQTRLEFDLEMLQDLAESIKANGVVQPIVVRPGKDGHYVLVLGERRCRASKLAGKDTIPAIVRRVSDQQAAEMTVVENLQRQDLNCMEQAAAFAKLSRDFDMTQEQIGQRVGVSRESVSNYMRMLKLPGTVMRYLQHGALGFSDARVLLRLQDNATIEKLAEEAVTKQWSSMHLESVIEQLTMKMYERNDGQPTQGRARWVDPNVRAAQQELQRTLGLKVKISDRKGKGKIVIEYASVDDYERVVGMLRGEN